MTSETSRILVENLEFRYGKDGFQLRVPEFRVGAGESVGCIGPSGSGKTTFLHLLAGILLPERGTVEVDGVVWSRVADSVRRKARLARIGLVFQEFELLEHLTVEENIRLPGLIDSRLGRELDRSRATELARQTGIDAYLRRKPHSLSQGERQRVAVCRALFANPAVVLADEPTGNLDPARSREVVAALQQTVRQQGVSLVMVTHDHGLLDGFDRVLDLSSEVS